MVERHDTWQNPQPFGQPSRGRWQYPNSTQSTRPLPVAPLGGQPAAGTVHRWPQPIATEPPPSQYQPQPHPQLRSRRRIGTTLLAITTVLSFIAATTFGTLYVTERMAHNRSRGTLATQQSQLDGAQRELDSSKSELTAAEQARRDQDSRNAELASRNAQLQKCVDATAEFFAALQANDQARGDRAIAAMLEGC
jgi:hypothetical protein